MLDNLKEALKNAGFEPQNSSNWFTYRKQCIYCGGSSSTVQDHLNILVDDTGPLITKCFRPSCSRNRGGVLSPDDMRTLGIFDEGLIKYVTDRNKSSNLSRNIKFGSRSFLYGYINNDRTAYFKARTGIILNKELVIKYKLILDFNKFCDLNQLEDIGKKDRLRFIDCIGYMDKNNSFVRFRDIKTKEKSGRFKAYKFRNDIRDTNYNIGELDILSSDSQTVHIAEGFFDIVNINNMFAKEGDLSISTNTYASFITTINNIVNQKPEVNIILYLDSDIRNNMVVRDLRYMKYKLQNKVIVRRNLKSKDFGDIREEIELFEEELNFEVKRYRRR